MLTAPWTNDQVQSLNEYQTNSSMHPFTSEAGDTLIATIDGWVIKVDGPVVQDWCHEFMADWSWKKFSLF